MSANQSSSLRGVEGRAIQSGFRLLNLTFIVQTEIVIPGETTLSFGIAEFAFEIAGSHGMRLRLRMLS